jgi:GNAT superfamily N-acetyltransferase
MERLGEKDRVALQSLVDSAGDYYRLVYGAPADAGEAALLLGELPPGKTLADKFMFGFFRGLDLYGVIDVVRGYRDADEWYLGLLLLRPWARSGGRGTMILEEVVGWLRAEGCKRVRLAVAEQNVRALRFWERHDFQFDKRFPPKQLTARETVFLELVREL